MYVCCGHLGSSRRISDRNTAAGAAGAAGAAADGAAGAAAAGALRFGVQEPPETTPSLQSSARSLSCRMLLLDPLI